MENLQFKELEGQLGVWGHTAGQLTPGRWPLKDFQRQSQNSHKAILQTSEEVPERICLIPC